MMRVSSSLEPNDDCCNFFHFSVLTLSYSSLSLRVSLTLASKSHHHQELIKCIQLFLFFHFLFEIKLSFRDQVFSPSFLLLYVLKKNRIPLMQDLFFLLSFTSSLSFLFLTSSSHPYHSFPSSVRRRNMNRKKDDLGKSDLIAKAREEWEEREREQKVKERPWKCKMYSWTCLSP